MITDGFVQMVGLLIGVFVGLEVLKRAWGRWAPAQAESALKTLQFYYLYPYRWVLPDFIYKLWLHEGIMTLDAYREFQQYGFIRDEIDPEYIQQYDSRRQNSE